MTMAKQMPGAIIRPIPNLHGIMAHDNHLSMVTCRKFWKLHRYQRGNHLYARAGSKIFSPGIVVTARENFYVAVQPAHPFCEMSHVTKRKISEMVDSILFSHDTIPFFNHDRIHLVHALKWTIEIRDRVFIIKMCIGGKECSHDSHLIFFARFTRFGHAL